MITESWLHIIYMNISKEVNFTDSCSRHCGGHVQTLVLNQRLSVKDAIYYVQKWWHSIFIETNVIHIFMHLLMLSTTSLDAAFVQLPCQQLPFIFSVSHFQTLTDWHCTYFFVCMCVCLCVLLQRKGSACLLVLVGVQPWEASTRGGCDYVTMDCLMPHQAFTTNINSLQIFWMGILMHFTWLIITLFVSAVYTFNFNTQH